MIVWRFEMWIMLKKDFSLKICMYSKDSIEKKKGSLCPCGTIILREN